jgi:hypothetical protein
MIYEHHRIVAAKRHPSARPSPGFREPPNQQGAENHVEHATAVAKITIRDETGCSLSLNVTVGILCYIVLLCNDVRMRHRGFNSR